VRTARRGVIASAVLAWLFLVVLVFPAHAHTTLVSSTPADGAQVDSAPATVELVFSEPVDPRLVTVVVSSTDGTQWQDGAALVSEAAVSQAVRPLVNGGDYTVAYRVVSADGHPVTGQLTFSVAAPIATPTADASAASTPDSTPASRSRPVDDAAAGAVVWTYAAIGLPIAALLFAGGMLLARSRGRSRGGNPSDGR
jgi:copper resistance protein C